MEEAIYLLCERISSLATKLETAIEKNNDTLKKINRELLISNLPKHLHNDQRHYFKLDEAINFHVEMREHYKERLEKAKKEGDKEKIEKYEALYKVSDDKAEKTLKDLIDLEEKGCVDL